MTEQNLIQSAEAGDVSAMLKLAKYYEEKGRGNRIDDKVGDVISMEDFNKMIQAEDDDKSKDEFKALAYKYYRMAAEAGNAQAMTEVGHKLYDGIGVEKSDEYEIWWRRGAEAGDPEGMRIIAFFCPRDDEERFKYFKDFVNALIWYKKAATKGSRDAMSLIGDIYYIGEDGVEQSYTKAFKWYSRAAARGYNMAKIKMTLMLYRGLGVEQNLLHAFRNFSKISWTRENFGPFSPFRFNSVARYYAAKMREKGEGCTADPVDALERYKVAGGLERVQPYESARRIPRAIYKVADAYFLGEGTKQNFGKALKFYEKTFTQGDGRTPYHREAVKKIIWMYELGEGVPKNKEKANEWRKKLGDND